MAGPHAAAHLEQLAQGDAERRLVLAGARDVAAEGVEREAGDFSLPMERNHSLPRFMMAGTEAMDSTLFTTVGQA